MVAIHILRTKITGTRAFSPRPIPEGLKSNQPIHERNKKAGAHRVS